MTSIEFTCTDGHDLESQLDDWLKSKHGIEIDRTEMTTMNDEHGRIYIIMVIIYHWPID